MIYLINWQVLNFLSIDLTQDYHQFLNLDEDVRKTIFKIIYV
jgi:hypothetical protein